MHYLCIPSPGAQSRNVDERRTEGKSPFSLSKRGSYSIDTVNVDRSEDGLSVFEGRFALSGQSLVLGAGCSFASNGNNLEINI